MLIITNARDTIWVLFGNSLLHSCYSVWFCENDVFLFSDITQKSDTEQTLPASVLWKTAKLSQGKFTKKEKFDVTSICKWIWAKLVRSIIPPNLMSTLKYELDL